MIELLRSNDVVLMSFVRSLLSDAGIPFDHLDQNMSIMEGSLGVLQSRMMVAEHRLEEARNLLAEAGVEIAKL